LILPDVARFPDSDEFPESRCGGGRPVRSSDLSPGNSPTGRGIFTVVRTDRNPRANKCHFRGLEGIFCGRC
jgi:hypothetical protein